MDSACLDLCLVSFAGTFFFYQMSATALVLWFLSVAKSSGGGGASIWQTICSFLFLVSFRRISTSGLFFCCGRNGLMAGSHLSRAPSPSFIIFATYRAVFSIQNFMVFYVPIYDQCNFSYVPFSSPRVLSADLDTPFFVALACHISERYVRIDVHRKHLVYWLEWLVGLSGALRVIFPITAWIS